MDSGRSRMTVLVRNVQIPSNSCKKFTKDVVLNTYNYLLLSYNFVSLVAKYKFQLKELHLEIFARNIHRWRHYSPGYVWKIYQ